MGLRPRRTDGRAPLAALLSFLWPGLGQAYRGRGGDAAILALPPAAVALVLIALLLLLGPLIWVVHLLNPLMSLGLLLLALVLGAWRTFSIFNAAYPGGRGANVVAVLLTGAVIVSHAWVAAIAFSFYEAGQRIYEPSDGANAGQGPMPTLAPGSTDGAGPGPATSPSSSQTPADNPLPGTTSRVTVLLVGIDNTHAADRGLTDSLIVASFDPVTRSLTMISIPRDTGRLPFYRGGEFGPRINTLMQTAARNPDEYPDGPLGTLVNEVSYIVGIPIHYSARIDIAGFTTLIDAVGGVDIVLDSAIADSTYQFSATEIGFHLEAGPHHLDGKLATAFARSRHGAGNSDYERAKRQQQLLLAVRQKLNDPLVIANASAVISAVSEIIRTDAPLERLPDILSIALRSQDAATRQVVLRPPNYAQGVVNENGLPTSMNQLRPEAVAALSIELFGAESRYFSPGP